MKATAFSAGTEETTAILAGQLDAAYVGPNPAINAWQKSSGTAIKIISGAATGGASIVVKKGITSAAQLKGKSLATPSLGNTQDVALRYWLKQNGVTTTTTGGGDAFVKPTKPNSAAVLQFKSGQIAGGSEPAPYDIQMVNDGGTVLLSEPGVTTLLVVTQSFLSAHPAVVADLLKAQVQANDFIKSNPTQAQADANAELASYTGKPLKASIVAASFKEITFTNDPDAASLKTDADAGHIARPAQAGQPERDLRTRPAQQGAGRGRRIPGQLLAMVRQVSSVTVTDRRAAPPVGGSVRLTGVSKVFGRGDSAVRALDNVSLEVPPGEFTCLIGASGCGKSTLLSLVAGLEQPTSGEVSAGGGRVAFMFQEPALFPWLTAAGNVELALRARGLGKAERRQRTEELLETVHLTGFGGKRPHQLSGGMRQRVALARALAQDADVLLMDEPFGALDAMTRDVLHDELDRICAGRALTVLFVTHNVREAVRLGDRVVVLSSRPGRVIAEFDVPIERPRRIDSAPVAELAAQVTDRLREEMSRDVR